MGKLAKFLEIYKCAMLTVIAVLLANLLKKIENEKAGIHDPYERHRRKPLSEHLNDWLESLRASGRGSVYVTLKANRVRAAVDGCGWVFPGDMTADQAETFLADLRSRCPDLPPMPEGVESFKVREVGTLLGGVSRQTVAALIRQHRLTATGRGKKRRVPRETVETLRGLKDRGRSSQSSNHYLQAFASLPSGWRTTTGSTGARSPG